MPELQRVITKYIEQIQKPKGQMYIFDTLPFDVENVTLSTIKKEKIHHKHGMDSACAIECIDEGCSHGRFIFV